METPAYYRARLDVIAQLLLRLALTADREEKNSDYSVLRSYGTFPKSYDERAMVNEQLKKKKYSNEPLDFMEITLFNNWFAMHPEKVAGEEYITTSREFPVQIKGTKEDIIRTIKGEKQIPISKSGAENLPEELETLLSEVENELTR